MTNKQLYFLCGTIAFSARVIANSLNLSIFALACFIFAVPEKNL